LELISTLFDGGGRSSAQAPPPVPGIERILDRDRDYRTWPRTGYFSSSGRFGSGETALGRLPGA